MHATTATPRPRRSMTAAFSAVAATAVLATTLALPALAQDGNEPAERGDPGERHAELLAELEGLEGDTDAIAAALAAHHEERMAARAERQEERQQARDDRPSQGAGHGNADGAPRHGAVEDRPGPEGDGPRHQHEQQGERQGPGPRDGTAEDCPLASS